MTHSKKSKIQYKKYFVKIRFVNRETGEENVDTWYIRCESITDAVIQAGFTVRVDMGKQYEVSEVLEVRKVS